LHIYLAVAAFTHSGSWIPAIVFNLSEEVVIHHHTGTTGLVVL